jgi:dolichol-phosphate mannosyltransferase
VTPRTTTYTKRTDDFVSVVAPISNDADILDAFVRETSAVLEEFYANYELVLVDDGSTDATSAHLTSLLAELRCIRVLRLSRRHGTEVAIAAGLDGAIGDFVVVMLPEFDPPRLVPEMINRIRAGAELVYGVRVTRGQEPAWARLGASVFYTAGAKLFDLRLARDSTFLRVMTRQTVNAIVRMKDKSRYLRLLSLEVAAIIEPFPYAPIQRRPTRRRRGALDSFADAIGIAVAHSTRPLRIASGLGLLASAANLLYMLYVALIYLFKPEVAEGWTTTSLQASAMFFLIFLIMAVMGEYLVRILGEARDRPLYSVFGERNSNFVVADVTRRNVVQESAASPNPSFG